MYYNEYRFDEEDYNNNSCTAWTDNAGHCNHMQKGYQNIVIMLDGENGLKSFVVHNHTIIAGRYTNTEEGITRIYIEVQRPNITWPGMSKVFDIPMSEDWRNYLPGWIVKYFQQGV